MENQWWVPALMGVVLFPSGIVMVRFALRENLGASSVFRAWVVLLGGLVGLIGAAVVLLGNL